MFSNVPICEAHIKTILPWSQTTESLLKVMAESLSVLHCLSRSVKSWGMSPWQTLRFYSSTFRNSPKPWYISKSNSSWNIRNWFLLSLELFRCSLFGKTETQSQDTEENGIDMVGVHKVQPWEVFITLKSHFWPSEDWRCQRKPVDELLGWADVYWVPDEEGYCCAVLEGWLCQI